MCQIIITVRFSQATSHFQKRKGRDYLEWLYSDQRMEERFEYFENLTLPSILHQTDLGGLTLQVLSSRLMPEKYRTRLRHSVAGHEFIELSFLEGIPDPEEALTVPIRNSVDTSRKGEVVVSARFDDDDLLSRHYVRKVKEYARQRENLHKTLSFARGAIFELDSGRTCPRKYPLVSVGLCHISTNDRFKSIFEFGDHTKIKDMGFPVIIDHSKMMYVLTNGHNNMTGRMVAIHRQWFFKKLLVEYPMLSTY
jgi:hypothetical protein